MKKILIITLLIAPFIVKSQNFNLKLNIKNIKNIKGHIQIGLYNSSKNFLDEDHQYKTLCLKVNDKYMVHTIKNLPKDTYAIALFHDENSDSRINKNTFGIPTESFGFSNNYKPIFRAPKFKETAFRLDNNHEISISLIEK